MNSLTEISGQGNQTYFPKKQAISRQRQTKVFMFQLFKLKVQVFLFSINNKIRASTHEKSFKQSS